MAATATRHTSSHSHTDRSQFAPSGHSSSSSDALLSRLRAEYTAADQSHVFTFYDSLSSEEKNALLTQLASIDIHRVNRIYKNAVAADGPHTPVAQHRELEDVGTGKAGFNLAVDNRNNLIGRSRTPSPPPISEWSPLRDEDCATVVNNPTEEAEWRELGLKAIADNSVAVLLLAGGQGTRLGSSLPKGMYDINLPSKSSLFSLQAGRIARLARLAESRYGKEVGSVRIRWYVMTSGPTRPETERFFKEQGYFGLNENDVIFFEQGTSPHIIKLILGVLPALSNEGKLLLASPSSLSVAPDGNGGLYAALRRPMSSSPNSPTILADMRSNGIEHIHVYGVDNCLVRVADPVFVGVCIARKAECGAKVVRKTVPTESVGVVARRGEAFGVVEYSELSREKSEMRHASGQLAFRAANIANHYFTMDFLDRVEMMERKMAFHIARKKIPTVSLTDGSPVKPSEPNGMKLELFVFDVFPYTHNLTVLEVERQEEFSPLKNAPGSQTDGPETSRRDLLAQQKRWLEAQGARLGEGVEVEVLPQVTYGGEGLEWVKGTEFVKSGVIVDKGQIGGLTA